VARGAAPRTQVLAGGALDLLELHCASCHSNDASESGVGAVLNVPGLITRSQLVPGSSATSPFSEVLGARLGELDARLGPLANVDGSVDRATFSDVLGSASCVLHVDAAQHPTRCP